MARDYYVVIHISLTILLELNKTTHRQITTYIYYNITAVYMVVLGTTLGTHFGYKSTKLRMFLDIPDSSILIPELSFPFLL